MKVYDSIYPSDREYKPSVPLDGCLPVLVEGQRFYAAIPNTGGARDLSRYDPAEARQWPKLAPGALVVVNIESRADRIGEKHRPLRSDIRLNTARDITPDIAFTRSVILDVRSGSERAPVGLYGILPTGFNVFNSVLSNDQMELRRVRIANDYLALELLESLDFLAPSLYVNSTNERHWRDFASWQINECRRLSPTMPVIPFIGPQIHPSAGVGLISPTFWENQMVWLRRQKCDGVVVWYSGPEKTRALQPYMDIASRMAKELAA